MVLILRENEQYAYHLKAKQEGHIWKSPIRFESSKIQFSEFKLYTGEANTQEATLVSTGHNDAAGNITFGNRLSFDHAGTYFFGMVEKGMEGSITSDRHWYKVAVTVGTKLRQIA